MAYGCTLSQLLAVLEHSSFRKTLAVRSMARECEYGLLSVGLKIHLTELSPGFALLVKTLGGTRILEQNIYRQIDAAYCFVLPPVGNAETAILLLECIEEYTETSIFGNPKAQLQICSPGRLENRHAALLGIAFYLGSDTLRKYRIEDLQTTVSMHNWYARGRRVVLYDAGGIYDSAFKWWETAAFSRLAIPFVRARMPNPLGLAVRHRLPFGKQRTDILGGAASPKDLRNVNLIATLLVHAAYPQHAGYWHELGRSFVYEMEGILMRHQLGGLLKCEWVLKDQGHTAYGEATFTQMLAELVAYAFSENDRILKARDRGIDPGKSILDEVQECLEKYRDTIRTTVDRPEGERP